MTQHPGYEVEDAHPRLIGIVAALVTASVLASLAVVAFLFHARYREVPGQTRQTPFTRSPEYRTSIATSWTALDVESQRNLHHYEWIDREHGVVRIPIDRAMDRLVQEASNGSQPR